MKTKLLMPMLALFLVLPLMMNTVQSAPIVSIQPDITIDYGDITYINGTGFANNTSVRVDIIFPSGVNVEGVANNVTNATGNFSIAISLPDVDGSGYIKVVCGSDIISTLVTFKGTTDYNIDVTKPKEPVVDEYSIISVEVDGITGYNILKCDVIDPTDDQTFTYWVLIDGKCDIPYLFDEEGRFDFEITIVGTNYTWSGIISAGIGSGDPDPDPQPNTNVTWNVVNSDNIYTITLFKSGSGYVQTGIIKVIKPDSSVVDVPISMGSASITASTKGTYQMQYTTDGILFSKSFEYSPVAVLSVAGFSETGQTTLTYSMNGKVPTDVVTVQVSGAGLTSVITLVNGAGSYSTTAVGSYSFTVTHMGVTSTASSTYADTYTVEGFTVSQSEDTDYLVISGRVVGVNSGAGKPNANVNIKISELGYSGTAKTGESGSFRLSIPLSSSAKGGFFGGATVSVAYDYGESVGDASTKLSKNWVGDYWLLWVFAVIVLLFIAKEKGFIYKYFKVLPPRGTHKPEGDASFDEPFFG